MPISTGAPTFAELELMLDGLARDGAGGLIVLADVSTLNYRDGIIGLAARYRLPAVYPERIFAAAGGLMSYGADGPALRHDISKDHSPCAGEVSN